jgi:hypothetical protein
MSRRMIGQADWVAGLSQRCRRMEFNFLTTYRGDKETARIGHIYLFQTEDLEPGKR